MEKEGLIRGLKFLREQGMTVSSLTTDRPSIIKKHIRLQCPEIIHYFDVWHVGKGEKKFMSFTCNRLPVCNLVHLLNVTCNCIMDCSVDKFAETRKL